MAVRLCRWGNSTGLRLPLHVMQAAGLKIGRYVNLRVLDNGDIRLRPVGDVVPAEAEGAGALAEPEPPQVDRW